MYIATASGLPSSTYTIDPARVSHLINSIAR